MSFWNFYDRSIAWYFSDHFLIEVSSDTLFLSSLTSVSVVFEIISMACKSRSIIDKFFTCFFVYVKSDLNFFRLTFRRIIWYFVLNDFIDVSLNCSIFSSFGTTRELVSITDHWISWNKSVYRIFDLSSFFVYVTSHRMFDWIYFRCIVRFVSFNQFVDVSLNITSFIEICTTSEPIIVDDR